MYFAHRVMQVCRKRIQDEGRHARCLLGRGKLLLKTGGFDMPALGGRGEHPFGGRAGATHLQDGQNPLRAGDAPTGTPALASVNPDPAVANVVRPPQTAALFWSHSAVYKDSCYVP